ncbi:MAG: bifunctional methylenetetrahydrofolate dehydrogenase/methenyltetrahydrofolate cyclohydrolase FolD [Clostridia bacterium]|nr:bifunctional methylenetetrahydrofolate dehydrogenase/methenyltetrahydrofolate cyclohydrolase FolD [Clostridia bacterium]
MMGKLIDGKKISSDIREELKEKIAKLQEEKGVTPGLAVILVGDDPASQVYVRNKERACKETGIYSEVLRLPADITEEQLFSYIDGYNKNDRIHGLLVQFPVPGHLSQQRIIDRIDPSKDVDGLSYVNAGKLASGAADGLVSCTPRGILELVKRTGTQIEGKHVVIIGRSNLVGKPVAQLFLNENATVTICHSRTKDLPAVTRTADILIVAIGRPHFVKADFVKDGAIVIDVGTSRFEGKLTGDCDTDTIIEKASYITPVPGGVGPMTITMLLDNTVRACMDHIG